jgi:hypothetical protein
VYNQPLLDLVFKAASVHRMYNDPSMVRLQQQQLWQQQGKAQHSAMPIIAHSRRVQVGYFATRAAAAALRRAQQCSLQQTQLSSALCNRHSSGVLSARDTAQECSLQETQLSSALCKRHSSGVLSARDTAQQCSLQETHLSSAFCKRHRTPEMQQRRLS